jgi:hypothetical protein
MIKRIIKQIETPTELINQIITQLGVFGGGTSQQYIDGEVEFHEDLPISVGNPPTNSAYLVRKGQGIWLINRKPAGIWVRETDNGDLNDWVYAGSFPDVYNDANFRIYDNDDSSKNLAFNLDNLNSNTTVTLTIPATGGTVITDQNTGIFYTNDNPSGFVANVNLQKFSVELSTGIERYTGSFNQTFSALPSVVGTMQTTGDYMYVVGFNSITTSGFVADFSDIILESGVKLNIIAYDQQLG